MQRILKESGEEKGSDNASKTLQHFSDTSLAIRTDCIGSRRLVVSAQQRI